MTCTRDPLVFCKLSDDFWDTILFMRTAIKYVKSTLFAQELERGWARKPSKLMEERNAKGLEIVMSNSFGVWEDFPFFAPPLRAGMTFPRRVGSKSLLVAASRAHGRLEFVKSSNLFSTVPTDMHTFLAHVRWFIAWGHYGAKSNPGS